MISFLVSMTTIIYIYSCDFQKLNLIMIVLLLKPQTQGQIFTFPVIICLKLKLSYSALWAKYCRIIGWNNIRLLILIIVFVNFLPVGYKKSRLTDKKFTCKKIVISIRMIRCTVCSIFFLLLYGLR